MACTNKILARRNKKTGEIKFIGAVAKYTPEQIANWQQTNPHYDYIKLPCGHCIGCRLAKAKEWSVRIMHEAKTSGTACFITLTFDEERLYNYFLNVKKLGDKKSRQKAKQMLWTLDVKLFQDFMKRLRKEISPQKVRFFHCGEYGSKKSRPHHHAILFGYDFPDKQVRCYSKVKGEVVNYYYSPMLDKLWNLGYHVISECTENSAGYCARYVTKKVNGDLSDEYYNGRKKEYITMSRRPGIGYDWFKLYGRTDCYNNDYLLTNNKSKIKPPRYYDSLLELDDAELFNRIKSTREAYSDRSMRNPKDKTSKEDVKERASVRNELNSLKLKRLVRCLENDDNIDDFKFIEFINKCSAFGIPDEFVQKTIRRSEELENEIYSACQIANQYLNSVYGSLTYEDIL